MVFFLTTTTAHFNPSQPHSTLCLPTSTNCNPSSTNSMNLVLAHPLLLFLFTHANDPIPLHKPQTSSVQPSTSLNIYIWRLGRAKSCSTWCFHLFWIDLLWAKAHIFAASFSRGKFRAKLGRRWMSNNLSGSDVVCLDPVIIFVFVFSISFSGGRERPFH